MEIMTPDNIANKKERFKESMIFYYGEDAYQKCISGEDQKHRISLNKETFCVNLQYEDTVY